MTEEISNSEIVAALEAWKSVGLSKLLLRYGENGKEILSNQKECVQSRRELAEKTKEFRKKNEMQNSGELKTLLRAYQGEIDNLTKKMKYAEGKFLSLFKILNEVPDPEPYFERLLEGTKANLMDTQYKQEINKVKNENVLLARKLLKTKEIEEQKDQLRIQLDKTNEKMQGLIEERVVEREKEIKEETENLIQYLKNRELDLQQQLSEAVQNLDLIRNSHDMTQAELMELSQNKDRSLSTRLAEMDIVQADLDRSNAKITNLQIQNTSLKAEIQALKEGVGASSTVSEFQHRIETQEEEINRLVVEVETLLQNQFSVESSLKQNIEALELEVSGRKAEIEKLSNRINITQDYEEIKRELEIIKSVEYSVNWDEDEPENSSGNHQPLEKLLIKKTQNLQNSLTSTKNLLTNANTELEQCRHKIKVLEEDLAKKSTLVTKLEQDIMAVESSNLPTITSGENSIDTHNSNEKEVAKSGASVGSGYHPSQEAAILPIVTGQRDRFRQRNIELEMELRKQQTMIAEYQEKVERFERDNVGLYQQIRYLQSYSSSNNKARFTDEESEHGRSFNETSGSRFDDTETVQVRMLNEHQAVDVPGGSVKGSGFGSKLATKYQSLCNALVNSRV
ncbi:hypothetical protein BB559_001551 [Furculomyces boomerangus]|uniref:Protein CASP n=1 Tax=Furculomyces boomerangus TaxID=61424 RepID=A0A2T9Z1M6_9FUNG|nr:hypothetical protein BB559_001551 [Furculomyces boomerangus]